MSRRVFISYNFQKDKEFARNLGSFFKPDGPCDGTPHFVDKDVSAGGDAAIDAEIRRAMEGCAAAVFVCGDDVHNSPWINREAQLALSRNLGIVVVRAPRSTGGVPNVLRDADPPIVDWDRDALSGVLNPLIQSRAANG